MFTCVITAPLWIAAQIFHTGINLLERNIVCISNNGQVRDIDADAEKSQHQRMFLGTEPAPKTYQKHLFCTHSTGR